MTIVISMRVMLPQTGKGLDMNSKKLTIKKFRPLRLFSGRRAYDTSALIKVPLKSHRKLHAVDQPAIRFDDGAEEWWMHGRLQSQNDFPAAFIEESNAGIFQVGKFEGCLFHEQLLLTPLTSVWCEDGFIHRDSAPAVITYGDEDIACEQWWRNGFRHRVGEPAYTSQLHDMWFEDGLLHRIDGPAVLVKNHGQSKASRLFSPWYWHGAIMVLNGMFSERFDYAAVPPEFVLRALACLYEQIGTATVCDEAIMRASEVFPDLALVLGATSGTDECGNFVASRILRALGGEVDDAESYSVEGLLEDV